MLFRSLGSLCERFDVVLVRPHDALADADATAAVLPHLLAAHGITSSQQVRDQLVDRIGAGPIGRQSAA